MKRLRDKEEKMKNIEAEKRKMKQDNDMHKMAQMALKSEIDSML